MSCLSKRQRHLNLICIVNDVSPQIDNPLVIITVSWCNTEFFCDFLEVYEKLSGAPTDGNPSRVHSAAKETHVRVAGAAAKKRLPTPRTQVREHPVKLMNLGAVFCLFRT